MLESTTESVSSFATAHPALTHGLVVAGGIVLAGAVIIGGTRFLARKLGVID